MTLPSLAEFIHFVPVGLATESPNLWLEGCLLSGSDRLIVVDGNRVPIGGLTLLHLLSFSDASMVHSAPGVSKRPDEPPSSHLAWLERSSVELILLPVTTPLKAAAQKVARAPDRWWVAVDDQQRYQGMVHSARLLGTVYTQLVNPVREDEFAADQVPIAKSSHKSTALITYLGHELKTPLTSLLGLSSLLKMGEIGPLSPRQNRYVNLIQQHCRRLSAWVNTLIDLGRVESGALTLIPQMVDVGEVCREAYRQAALRIGKEQRSLPLPGVLDIDGKPITIIADPTRLKQMLTCLMQTALATQTSTSSHFSEMPLKIRVWEEWITFGVEGVEEHFEIDQWYTSLYAPPFLEGGIPPASLTAEMGHWLEWLLVRKLAQQHQGELVLTAPPNAGISPTLILPMTPMYQASQRRRFLVVVVPPNLESLAPLKQQAKQLNYQLIVTHQIRDAVEVAQHLAIAAVLVVLQSGTMDEELVWLQSALSESETLTVALVPPHLSAHLGALPLDRDLLWPNDRLGSVLLHPPSSMPVPSRLTILYLRSTEHSQSDHQKFPHIFHDFGCRVLEVDDLSQANMLQRVWKPDVAILDPAIASPGDFLQNFMQFSELASLPVITLTMGATQAAQQISKLAVYPCLVEEVAWSTPEAVERLTSWLIQVLQVAASETVGR